MPAPVMPSPGTSPRGCGRGRCAAAAADWLRERSSATNAASRTALATQERERHGIRPAIGLGAGHAVHEREQAGRGRSCRGCRAGTRRRRGRGGHAQRADGRRDGEQDPDVEAPAPVEHLGEEAAEQQAERAAAPAMAPKTPNALARSCGSVNVVANRESAAGASIAAKTPCSARAPTSSSKLWAAPPSADAPAKPTRPAMNVHLRPNRSAMRPPSSSRLPNASA